VKDILDGSATTNYFDSDMKRSRLLFIEMGRLGFLVAILLISVSFQILKPNFFSVEVVMPLYWILASSFLLNALYLYFFSQSVKTWG